MRRLAASYGLALAAGLLIAACGGTTPSPSATATAPVPSPTIAPSPTTAPPPSGTPLPTPSTSGTPGTVTSFAQAAALVLASDPRFADVGPQQFDVIGQCCWYDVIELEDGWQVTVELGWDDCPSGCINRHRWVFHVARDGTLELISEEGDEPIANGGLPGSGPAQAVLLLVAGPTCPVETNPLDPNCLPRPVVGAEAVLRAPDGTELARPLSDADGRILLVLPPGTYWLEPLPVEGLLGTAAPIAFTVGAGDTAAYTLYYDTAIR